MIHPCTSVMALDAFWPVGRGLARMLQRSPMIDWAGLAIDTASWREMLLAARPDVALIDGLGFRESPEELSRITRSVSPGSRTVAFVPVLEEPLMRRWYDAGAAACIAKWMEPEQIVQVLLEVRRSRFDRNAPMDCPAPAGATA